LPAGASTMRERIGPLESLGGWQGTATGLMADRSDFEKTAMLHLDAVYRAAVAMCRDRTEADDLAQTTFLKAFEKFHTFRPGTSAKAWLMRILRNTWIDRIRHIQAGPDTVSVDEDLLAGPDDSADQLPEGFDAEDLLEKFSDDQIIRALKQLGDDQRLGLLLLDVEGLSQEEVAEIMGTAVGTIKSRTYRARAMLKKILAAHARDLGFPGHKR